MAQPVIRGAKGFSITELVVVISIATILAAFAAARINTASFDTEGYANQLRAAIRYAQKIAISQRRNVTVTVGANAVSLTYSGGGALRMPPGTEPFTVNRPAAVALEGTLAGGSFTFSPLGDPGAGGTIIVKGGAIPDITITVEGTTGYVH